MEKLMSVTAYILAGGFGTRLQCAVSDKPKPLADINGVPFIVYLLDQIAESNISKVIIGTGYKSEMFPKLIPTNYKNLDITFLTEDEPLGTAGALALAKEYIDTDYTLVLNGDSYIDAPLMNFPDYTYDFMMKSVYVNNASRYGTLLVKDDLVIKFVEKDNTIKPGWINGGQYLIKSELLNGLEKSFSSLERDYFPTWDIHCFKCNDYFIDIGIPEDYQKAQEYFKRKQNG